MTNYPPELIEDFEKAVAETGALLSLHKHSKEKIYTSTRTCDALQVFAHNWHRVRELGDKLNDAWHMLDSTAQELLLDRWRSAELLEKGNE